jgi:hypothetical protein
MPAECMKAWHVSAVSSTATNTVAVFIALLAACGLML